MFIDSQFMSAKEKECVFHAWERFLRSGFKRGNFTKALYHHLIQHCSFIAHYDIHGFYAAYFEGPETKRRFLSQFDRNHERRNRSVEIGMDYWLAGEYTDINNAMCDVATEIAPEIYAESNASERQRDFDEACRLLAKHGVVLDVHFEEAIT